MREELREVLVLIVAHVASIHNLLTHSVTAAILTWCLVISSGSDWRLGFIIMAKFLVATTLNRLIDLTAEFGQALVGECSREHPVTGRQRGGEAVGRRQRAAKGGRGGHSRGAE